MRTGLGHLGNVSTGIRAVPGSEARFLRTGIILYLPGLSFPGPLSGEAVGLGVRREDKNRCGGTLKRLRGRVDTLTTLLCNIVSVRELYRTRRSRFQRRDPLRAALRITHLPMSQSQNGSEPTVDEGNSDGRLFRSLRRTAEMHDISPSYLSRCVREGKNAKGHDLCPYVLFEETGDGKKIFGFAFPPGYEPADSAVDGNEQARPQGESENGRDTGAVRQKEESHRTEEGYQGPTTNGFLPEDSPDEVSRVQEDIDDLKDDVGELESVITEVANALGQIAQELAESRERQERIEEELTGPTGQMQEWRQEEAEKFRDLRQWLRDRFEQLSESRREEAEHHDRRFDHLNERIGVLREWVETVVDDAQEDLEWSRERALQKLSDELQEEIRDPILDILADDDESENLWASGIGFAVVLAVIEILDKRPDLVVQAVSALGRNSATGNPPLSSPASGEGGQEGSASEQGGGARSSDEMSPGR